MTLLAFKTHCDFPRGTISSLLSRSYEERASAEPGLFQERERDWRQYDDDIHSQPNAIGRSGITSCLGDTVIGFGSWDRRAFPVARVGHNCLLPVFRGNGYGAA